MSSGIAVSEEIVTLFEAMKVRHTCKYFLCKINEADGEIQLEKKVDAGEGKDFYGTFVSDLPPKEGRYAVYDFDYTTNEGQKRNKLLLIVWAPDDAPIKEKMLYASSKAALKAKINGIQFEVQGTDYDEVEWDYIFEKYTGKGTK